MHGATRARKLEEGTYLPAAGRAPRRGSAARMHQGLNGARHETIVHEEVFVDVESAVKTLEITGAITSHAMPQGQVLRARRRTDGVGLHEAQAIQRALQRCWSEEAARDGGSPQVVECHMCRTAGLKTRRY